jgi:hypothetical protein
MDSVGACASTHAVTGTPGVTYSFTSATHSGAMFTTRWHTGFHLSRFSDLPQNGYSSPSSFSLLGLPRIYGKPGIFVKPITVKGFMLVLGGVFSFHLKSIPYYCTQAVDFFWYIWYCLDVAFVEFCRREV